MTARTALAWLEMGCDEVSLGDTTGTGTPCRIGALLREVLVGVPAGKLAGHFHDTYGSAIANMACALDMGLRVFDSSIAGLGGCPFAPGASGNMATEDAAWFLEREGMQTGLDAEKLAETGEWARKKLGRTCGARVGAALTAKRAPVRD